MATYKTKAISLKTHSFAEADKLVTLFTREVGKVKAIAKGARRGPSCLAGRVEPLSYADFYNVKGRNLDIISQIEMIETFQFVRESETLLPTALYMIRLVDAGTLEGQPNPELFDLLLYSLAKFKKQLDPASVADDFARDFLVLEGIFQEELDPRCVLSEHLGRDLSLW